MTEDPPFVTSDGPKLCECGCGEPTRLAPKTKSARGEVKGQPQRFLHGHAVRAKWGDETARFWASVAKGEGCWEWLGATTGGGYGVVRFRGRQQGAHRVSYTLVRGEIPDGLHLDHLCRNRVCVNPEHLEPVTPKENVRRGLGGVLTTHCPQGHPYSPENTSVTAKGARQCILCKRDAAARAYQRKLGLDVPLRPRGRPAVR